MDLNQWLAACQALKEQFAQQQQTIADLGASLKGQQETYARYRDAVSKEKAAADATHKEEIEAIKKAHAEQLAAIRDSNQKLTESNREHERKRQEAVKDRDSVRAKFDAELRKETAEKLEREAAASEAEAKRKRDEAAKLKGNP